MRRYVARLILFGAGPALLAALFCCLGGCMEEDAPCGPCVPAGRIEGTISSNSFPLKSEVVIRKIDGDDNTQTQPLFEVEPNDVGYYFLDVPAGRYTVALHLYRANFDGYYSVNGLTPDPAAADTIRIRANSAPTTIDFDLAGASVDVSLSYDPFIDGVNIYLYLVEDAPEASQSDYRYSQSTAIAEGHVTAWFPDLMPGTYAVMLRITYRSESGQTWNEEALWLPGTYAWSEAERFVCEIGETRNVTCDLSAEPGRLRGGITGAWLELETYAPRLYAVSGDSCVTRRMFGLEEDGGFEFAFHCPGSFKIRTRDYPGPYIWFGGDTFAEATAFEVGPGVTPPDVNMVRGGARASIDPGGCEVGGIYLSFHDPATLEMIYYGSWYNGEEVRVAGIPLGDYLARLSSNLSNLGRAEWKPQWYDGAATPGEATVVSITEPGQIVDLDFTLERGGVIGGGVLREEAEYLYLFLTAADDDTLLGYDILVSEVGGYSFAGLPDGDYKIGCVISDYMYTITIPEGTVWHPNTTDWQAAEPITIQDASVVEDVDFDLR